MSTFTGGNTAERSIGTALAERTLQQVRGHHQPYCVSEEPKRAYYVSNLTPPEDDDGSAKSAEIKPNSIGLDFRPTGSEYPLTIEFEVYYRTHPTYSEYQELSAAGDVDRESEEEADTSDSSYAFEDPFYRRVDVAFETELSLGSIQSDAAAITRKLHAELDAALEEATTVTRPTTTTLDPENIDVELDDLSQSEYNEVLDKLRYQPIHQLAWPLEFTATKTNDQLRLRLELNSFDDRFTIPQEDQDAPELIWSPDSGARQPKEECVFNPVIEVAGSVEAYELDLVPEDYRFSQEVWAKGHNCSVDTNALDSQQAANAEAARPIGEFELRTTAVPTASVYEFDFRETHDTRFLTLAGTTGDGTIEALRSIARGMREYHDEWTGGRKEEFKDTHSPEEVSAFKQDAEAFSEVEIERFEAGIEMLAADAEARRAFQVMNRVNHRVHSELATDEGFDGWRLFQLVYIVSNLPDIVARDPAERRDEFKTEFEDDADVLWFPTGGGKTEAYLGIVLTTLFFDRIRGKDRGVSAWIRFPLRLLSSQQKSRFLKALLVAEEYRRADGGEDPDEFGLDGAGDEFSLGYFVGGQDTPNSIGSDKRELYQSRQEAVENDCQVVSTCPLCGSDVTVEFDETRNLVEHYCLGDDCVGRLPLYVVDHDVYRYLPSVLLGSLDKVSVMGFQPRFTNIFGNMTTQCSVHGPGYSDRCPEKDICSQTDNLSELEPGTRADRDSTYFDPIPSLHLVDEVHLLNEELGTFAGHYETAYLEFCRLSSSWQDRDEASIDGGVQPKVLTSTATISKYERQIQNLFQKDAVRFPQDGPELRETYYGELSESDVEREYGGVTPNNRTHLYAVLDFIKRYHETIRDYHDASPEEILRDAITTSHSIRSGTPRSEVSDSTIDQLVADTDWASSFDEESQNEILDKYETSLVYFTNKREKDTYRNSIGKQIADEMANEGYDRPLETQQLTADTQGTGVLDTLLDPQEEFENRTDTIPCTSFVGHGIDNPRFNFMLFFGYPSQTFQYIQASSRVGRSSGTPGFVVDFFRPFDQRDRHRYKYFETLHEHLERSVEPVAIDRWAKFGAEQTFPGILKSILLQYYRPKYYWHSTGEEPSTYVDDDGEEHRLNVQTADHFYEIMNRDTKYPGVTQEKMTDLVKQLYGTDVAKQSIEHVRTYLETESRRIWTVWNNELGSEMTTPGFPRGEGPMRSLRDIGDQGSVRPFDDTDDFLESLIGGGR